jgi:hypothetical protein
MTFQEDFARCKQLPYHNIEIILRHKIENMAIVINLHSGVATEGVDEIYARTLLKLHPSRLGWGDAENDVAPTTYKPKDEVKKTTPEKQGRTRAKSTTTKKK